MGVIIPQVVTEDRAGGALVIDGGLRFDYSKNHGIYRLPTSNGNRKTFTWSGWFKRSRLSVGDYTTLFSAINAGASGYTILLYEISSDSLVAYDASASGAVLYRTTQVFRDPSAWFHVVWNFDTTQSNATDRSNLYINGQKVTAFSTDNRSTYSQNTDTATNSTSFTMGIGTEYPYSARTFDGLISQVYLIDGQALDPSYFGYTDPLTNTWRPKKFSGVFSTPASALYQSSTTLNWASGTQESNWALSNSNKTATYSGSNTYADVFTAALNSSTTYAFKLNVTTSSGNGGWFFTDSTSISGTHPDERGSNSLGLRSGESGIGAYGTFASANSVTAGQDAIAGFGDVDAAAGSSIDMIINMSARKVWVRSSGTSSWIGGGDPSNSSSTASFLLPSGTVYLGFVEYNSTAVTLDTLTDATGINSFYLPFDGNSPIGQDQSGNGNNWTPVNFGGSNTIEKATGALPILNTDGGGKVARVGVRTDSNASSLVLALPLVGIKSDFSNAINSGTSNKAITANGDAAASSAQSNFYGGSFAFDGTGDYLRINASANFGFGSPSGNSNDFTIEWWKYWSSLSGYQTIWSNNYISSPGLLIQTGNGDGKYRVFVSSGTEIFQETNAATTGKWYHYALVRNGTTYTLYRDGVANGSGTSFSTAGSGSDVADIGQGNGSYYENGYIQDFRIYKGVAKYTRNFIPASTDPDILPDTPSGVAYSSNVALIPSTDGAVAFDGSGDYLTVSATGSFNTRTTFTVEFFTYPNSTNNVAWVESGTDRSFYIETYLDTGVYIGDGSTNIINVAAPPTGKWTHMALTFDGTTYRLFYDGVLQGSSTTLLANATLSSFRIGTIYDGTRPLNGFISNLHVVNGTALYTSNFTPPTAPITSVANTKLLCCKSNSSATAADVTPGTITANGNAAASNFNPFTVNINTQRGQESGYCTWNPLDSFSTLSNGNLSITTPSSNFGTTRGTVGVSSGKWYFEHFVVSGATALGVKNVQDYQVNSQWAGYTSGSYIFYSENNGYNKKANNNVQTDYGTNFGAGSTLGIALDLDAGTITFYVNGISQGVAYTGLSGTFSPVISDGTNSGTISGDTNFGQKPFKFPPPPGFQPLALANTPRPTVVRPDQYVGIVTGNFDTTKNWNVGFKPDLIWIKSRNNTDTHVLTDSVRGTNSQLFTSSAQAESTFTTAVTSFNRDGFTIGSYGLVSNTSTVAWCWKAGGNSNTFNIDDVGYATASAAGLTAGTITPTGASVNTKSGFSIIRLTTSASSGTYTVSHGLGKEVAFFITKKINGTSQWWTYHKSIGQSGYLNFASTAASATDYAWGANPTSSVITYTNDFLVGSSDYIIYAWAEIPGFSKFGSYTGNGSSDGPMVVTGFRPRWIMVKSVTPSTQPWIIYDTARDTANTNTSAKLAANSSEDENDATQIGSASESVIDVLSNGFKIRHSSIYIMNTSGTTYIYAAFAETPSFNLYGGQSNAR